MKKLMIAACAVAFAAAAQAATITWGNGYGLNAYDQPGDDGAAYSGTIYLIQGDSSAATTMMNTILAAGVDGYQAAFSTAVAGALASMTQTGFEPEKTTFSHSLSSGKYSFYTVALDTANKGIYVSEIVEETIAGVGDSGLDFSHDAAYFNNAFADTQKTYAGAGWYTAAAGEEPIPEPTSGLLLVLGLAGLALKRKHA